jgi:translation initiation factor 1A
MTVDSDIEGLYVEPDEDTEVYGVVVDMLGANRVSVRCFDGEERVCRIPGRMRKKVWIREDDIVIVEPWDWQDEKGDVVYRYEQKQVDILYDEGVLEDEGVPSE